ncbi:MAG: cytochrome c [Burkholderiales bacterium]|nr:cytochrome c [Burkholderiales bacterium]
MASRASTPRQRLSVATLAAIAGVAAALAGPANTAGAGTASGQRIFQQSCSACHTIGGGDLVGPDLKGVTATRPREWLERWIAAPDRMLAAKDPVATELLRRFHDVPMPNLQLGAAEVSAVLAYLESAAPGPAAQAAPASSTSEVAGDAPIGKELFTGTRRFANAGPPCMACHSVSGIGAFGGGQLGPDLTTVVTRLGGPGAVDAYLTGSPTWTMRAIWSRRPMTGEERADVIAFLRDAAVTERPAQAIWQLAGLALLGLAILLALAGWFGRGRLRDGVRRPMLARSRHAGAARGAAGAARRS